MASRLAVLLVVVASVSAADELQEGLYTLRNVNSGMYLDIEGGSNENGANVLVWNEPGASHSQWQLRSIGLGGVYTLQNAQSGMYLSTPPTESGSNGAKVFVWDATDWPESQWRFHAVSNGDGTAFSVENIRIGRFLSVEGASSDCGANVHLWSSPGKAESQWELRSEGSCHDAVPGEVCYNDTVWARENGSYTHPEWYPGLTSESSFADFQAHLHYCYWNRCPLPCASSSQHRCELAAQRFWDGSACQDAAKDSKCYGQITWAMEHGIHMHPEWYPSLTEQSSFREFQFRLFQGQKAGEGNSCSEPCCHDTLPGELCHQDASWAMLSGINIPEISDVYPPSLTNQSDFSEFQAYLHLCYPERCPEPCAQTEMMALLNGAPLGEISLDCPDTRKFR